MRLDLILRYLATATLTSALLVVWGCGREPKPEQEQPEQAAQPTVAPTPPKKSAQAVDNRHVIVAFGDSLTAGFGADPGQSYPDYLQRELDQLGYGYRIVNEGVSGDTTSGGLSRLNELTALKPDVVVLELGGNDGLRGIPVSNIKDNLTTIIEELRRTRSHILLAEMTLPPNYGQDYIQQFEALYRELAAKYHIPAFTFPFRELYEKGLMQPDGIHATAQGNQLVARTVLKSLTPMLAKPTQGTSPKRASRLRVFAQHRKQAS